MNEIPKYRYPEPFKVENRQWPDRVITKPPVWASVDLRDGNQALPEPMSPAQKLEYFDMLVRIGFKEIEVAFPSASADDFNFVRTLIEENHIPDDVRISVLTQARKHLIDKTVESLRGVKRAIVHCYVATSDLHGRFVFGHEHDQVRQMAIEGTRMVKDAIKRGCRHFIVGIGGSATNDGGTGMLSALGYAFLDKAGKPIPLGAKGLEVLSSISAENVLPELQECTFRTACDVTNPLCGEQGATYIFGPQKGVTLDMRENLDKAMASYASVVAETVGVNHMKAAGAGAAGGLGFAFLSFLNAELTPGIDLILDAVGLAEELVDADVVITGEGRLDHQTAMGKAPVGVARLAKKYGKRVLAFAGSVTEGATACNEAGIDAYFPIVRGITTLEEAMEPENARKNMKSTVEQVFRLL